MPRRRTWNDVAPNASTSPWKLARMPCTAAATSVTTNTPTATPMIVRLARTLFDRMASMAMPTPSLMIVRRSRIRIDLLLAKGGDRIEPRRATRRIHPRDDADASTDEQRQQDRPRCDARGQRSDGRNDLGAGDTEPDADRSAAHAERSGFHEELRQDVSPLGA